MYRRIMALLALALLALGLAGCHNKKVVNPLADVGSKQPDKVLFDRAMDQMKHNHFDQARLILQTLINTYPDSEYIARAKLAVGDSWYAEGGSAALAQAENEYKDFITFFPNMPEAAEAQLKIANIHFRQMEKPDRDFTHAKRAEEEYRQLVMQFPDSKLVPEAKERLREVQEVLAEREFRIGRFYYLRESWPAAIARLQSLVDTYPLYSGADEALFLLGNSYERQVDGIRASKLAEPIKGRLINEFNDKAAAAYARIITRYPVTNRADDAKKRLEALHRPVPTPTPEAIAQNKAEEASREELGRFSQFMENMHKRPDTHLASRVGDPTLVDPKQTNAPDVVKADTEALASAAGAGTNKVTVEKVGTGAVPPSQPVPRSDSQPSTQPAGNGQPAAKQPDNSGVPELQPLPSTMNEVSATPVQPATPAQGDAQAPPAPPRQVNEANADPTASKTDSASSSDSSTSKDPKESSSSKTKKKKGLKKLIPF